MMISQPALLCLAATWERMIGRGATELERDHAPASWPAVEALGVVADLEMETVATVPELVQASVPEQSLPEAAQADVSPPLTANERRARAAALRGLAFSRGRRFDAARTAFSEAARLDPLLDLTRVPGFWKLERAAHEAAIDAYQAAGRDRDEAVLRARVRSTYRPRPLRPSAGAAVPS